MKRRVLILEQQSYWGGGQRVLHMVLNSLQDVIDPVVAFPDSGSFCQDLQSQKIETLIYPLGNYQSGRKSFADILAFGPRSLCCALDLAVTILKRKLELVYINGPRCLLAGVMAARLTGRPSLFFLHNTLFRRFDVALASRVASHVSRIVACSQAAAAPLLRTNPALREKLQVLYPPVEELPPAAPCSALRTLRESSRFVIGIVGRITKAKGHHVLLDAVAKLDSCAEKQMIFVGAPAPSYPEDSSYLRYLRSLASERGLEGSLQWTGYQADPQPYYEAMDVLVVPSISEEGMPLVTLEACQRGIPVVASRVGGIPELIKDGVNGILVPPGSPEELAKALDRLQRQPGLCRQLGAAAHASIDERFSKKLYCSKIGGLISELCSSSVPV